MTTDAPLRSTTTEVDGAAWPSLVDFAGESGVLFDHDGDGIAGRGIARTIPLPGGVAADGAARVVQSALGAIARGGEEIGSGGSSGIGPVAVGALPFDPHAPGEFVVPAEILRRTRDGRAWITMVSPTQERSSFAPVAPTASSAPQPAADPDGFTLHSSMSHADWMAVVDRANKAIADGLIEKVVLAREVTVEANAPLSRHTISSRLRSLHPSCMVFAVGGFVGASPELLVTREGEHVVSHPLAGTISRSGDPEADARMAAGLLGSAKERHEHAVAVDAVAAVLRAHCDVIDVPEVPSILSLRNVAHLGTRISGRLTGEPRVLDLVRALHPTPAVAGTPTEEALAFILENEGFDRGRYAGPVGWCDAAGDGIFALGIRSAEIDGNRARMIAGVGVVDGSEPEAELAETQFKLQALLAAVVRP